MLLRTQIPLSMAAAVFVVVVPLMVIGQYRQQNSNDSIDETSRLGLTRLWDQMVASDMVLMRGALKDIARNRKASTALFKRDKAAAHKALEPTMNRFRATKVITDLVVADRNGEVFFASQDPAPRTLTSQIARQAAADTKNYQGLERGVNGEIRTVLAFPLLRRGKPVGVAVFEHSLGPIVAEIASVVDGVSAIRSESRTETVSDADLFATYGAALPAIGEGMTETLEVGGRYYRAETIPIPGWKNAPLGHLTLVSDSTDFVLAAKNMTNLQLAVVLVVLTLSVGGMYYFLRSTFGRLNRVSRALQSLMAGDTNVSLADEAHDEISAIVQAVDAFKDNIIRTQRLVKEREESKERAEAQRVEMLRQIASDFKSSVQGSVHTIGDNAKLIDDTSNRLVKHQDVGSSRVVDTAVSSADALNRVEMVAAAVEELTTSFNEVMASVQQSAENAEQARSDAHVVAEQIRKLSESANRITSVVDLINDFASQTNLLALNATIEAARAGEAGRGFAVVANEVKSLATQTSNATGEIGGQVGSIQADTSQAVTGIKRIEERIQAINEAVPVIHKQVDQQQHATQEIAENTAGAASELNKTQEMIADNTLAALWNYGNAILMIWAIEDLREPSDRLQLEITAFLDRLQK